MKKYIFFLLLIVSVAGYSQTFHTRVYTEINTDTGRVATRLLTGGMGNKIRDSLQANIALKNNISDTAAMLLAYKNLMIDNAAKKNNISDTANMLANYRFAMISVNRYVLSVGALSSSPTDGQTIFFGNMYKAPTATGAQSKIYIRASGTIKRAEIYCFSTTAGSNEAWPANIRLNNTTDTQIASLSVSAGERVFSNTALSIAVVSGDYIEIKLVNPTWATNPVGTTFGGYIYIE